ncbi:nck-associated protein 5-like isoform X1 [Anguilla anguilla]|uniref:nck-associated protein 5-like isoform X1 n=2 Tax=Anguilla anguilla TaxID=7936 RepID=UPI0015B097AC|nr:nck-associated protein 5-like isoform X1 [Anguilla anguilla]
MSRSGERAFASVRGRLRDVPLLRLLAEYMDSNKCIEELLKQLEEERRNVRREKLAVARLQREVTRSKSEGTMREKLMQELEEERGLRLQSERRLREVAEESELGRAQMLSLQQHFSRMEETVRSLLQNQGALEHTPLDTVDLMKVYKDKLSEEVKKQREGLERPGPPAREAEPLSEGDVDADADAGDDGSGAEGDRDKETRLLMERLRTLEAENSALAMENESQREQYERCLDEVANQVVQALLTQKDLREECLKLRTRVFDLEQQNRTLSVLFQQRVRPASDLLLQKLHSKIMGLSLGDLSLEPERSKSFLLPRNADSPPHDSQLNGKAGLPAGKCLGQLSVTVPLAAYPRSSCSSSELSISSACSDFSNSSCTWNEGKPSSLTWEKRGTLGSSTPSNICAPPEEQPPTRRKECHILEGLKRLQRHRPKEAPPLISKSGYKDCMNSNEGIYSLGLKCRGQGAPKVPATGTPAGAGAGSAGGRKFSYDSDDADDESSRAPPGRDRWTYSKRLTHSLSDSLCSWEGGSGGGDVAQHPQATAYDSKEQPEKLVPTGVGGFLYDGRTRAAPGSFPLPFEVSPSEADRASLRLSDTDEADSYGDGCERPERDGRCPADPRCEKRSYGRARSADSRPRPLSLLWQQTAAKSAQSEESIAAVCDANGEPIELSSQCAPQPIVPVSSSPATEYTELVPQEAPGSQGNTRNYSVLESPENPANLQSQDTVTKTDVGEGSAYNSQHLQAPMPPQQKLIKTPHSRAQKVHSVPPMHSIYTSKTNFSKIPGRGRGSPVKVAKGPMAETPSAPLGQEHSPSSPPVKLSRFIKAPGGGGSGGCSQSSKAAQASSRLPSRTDWAKSPSSNIPGSPVLPRRHLEHMDIGEQPTRDGPQPEVRSPSPPPPPGRTTSLLIRPNYDGSPQAPKAGIHPPVASTVRGNPPVSQTHPHHPLTALKAQDVADSDQSHSLEPTPQKQMDSCGHHQQKSPAALPQTPTRGSPKRGPIKLFHPSLATGHTADPHESGAKGSKNILQKGSSLQSTLSGKKVGPERDGGHPMLQKTSGSLPTTLQGQTPCTLEPHVQTLQVAPSYSGLRVSPQNSAERVAKVTRIPMGFKALVKSPPTQKESTLASAKQEKEHVPTAFKGTSMPATPDPLTPFGPEAAGGCSKPEGKPETHSGSMEQEPLSTLVSEHNVACERLDGGSRLFKRSISVTTKPHLKPALGMNGAKARSQSFSTNYMERPNIGVSDGPGKIRTQIITNTGERGNSLTRQSSLSDGFQLKPAAGLGETSPLSAFSRAGQPGASSNYSSPTGAPGKAATKTVPKVDTARAMPRGEACGLAPQKAGRSLSLTDRFGLKSSRQPQSESPHSPVCSPSLLAEGTAGRLPMKSGLKQGQAKATEGAEKLASPTTCTIEEKVMMGIQENVQKGQVQDRSQAPEPKQKSSSSLANWFGFRKTKLPAMGSKKVDGAKGKEEKKELKMGSVLGGGKQPKPDKKKEKRKNETQRKDGLEQAATESSDKLSLIMDRCSIQVGQLTNQIQHSTSCVGKDLFMKELLNRSAAKGDSHGAPLPGIPASAQGTPKNNGGMTGDSGTRVDTATKITQKSNPKAENEDDTVPEAVCQDHMIGSSCQTRTLDSGIGTFPLPDSVARATGRHLTKSASTPERALATPVEAPQDPAPTLLPRWKVPSRPETRSRPHSGVGVSLSDPTMTGSKDLPDSQSRLPKPSTSGLMNPKRRTQSESQSSPAQTPGIHDNQTDKGKTSKDHALSSDRALHVCTYSGSSGSEVETGPEDDTSVTRPSREIPPPKPKNNKPVDQEGMKRSSVGNRLSIMDYYQHFEEEQTAIPQYNSPGTEGNAGDPQSKTNGPDETTGTKKRTRFSRVSLESLNKLNSNGGGVVPDGQRRTGEEKPPRDGVERGQTGTAPSRVDNLGSLSDSLYDSFSSCTSQGSNDV